LAKRLQRRFLEIDQSETSFGSFSKTVSEEKIFSEIWWEAPMEGSVLSFLKAE
jgi:hypothetical protein